MEWYKKLVLLRESMKIKQGDFADTLCTSQKELSLLESGKKTFLPKWYMSYLLNENYDFNSLFRPELKLVKRNFKKSNLDSNTLDDFDKTAIIAHILDQLDSFKDLPEFKTLMEEASARQSGVNYAQRLKRLEAITAALLLERKSDEPLLSDSENEESNQ
jgi:transcriptional regulator with XRE-family HTH domain